MLLLFSIGVADCLKKGCFFSLCLLCVSFMNCCIPFSVCFEGRGVGSEFEKEHFN